MGGKISRPVLNPYSHPARDELEAPRLRLHLFGTMAVTDSGGGSFMPRNRKTRALFAMLALASPKPLLRVNISRLLWSRREADQARGSLRQSVREIQDVLGAAWSHLFIADRHYLALRGQGLDIDALAVSEPRISLDEYDFELPLLEDMGSLDPEFDRWLAAERTRFARIGRTIGENALAKSRDPESAIAAAERLLKIDRTHDVAWQAIIRGHAELENFASADDAYERLSRVLAEYPDTQPSLAVEELIKSVREKRDAFMASRRAVPDRTGAWGAALPGNRDPGRQDDSGLRLQVAPFRVIGPDPGDGLPAGLAEEVAAGLSRFRWISCIPAELWPSGQNIGDALAGGLDADLLLDCSIQYGAGLIHLQVRLLDARRGGGIAWVRRLNREPADAIILQDDVAAEIVADVEREAMRHERTRVAGIPPDDLSARDMALLALPAIHRMERSSFGDAYRLLETSLHAEPFNPLTLGLMSYWHVFLAGQGWTDDRDASAAEAVRLADRALMLDPTDALTMTLAGHARGFLTKQPRDACVLHERALAANPNLAIAWCLSGLAYSYLGDHPEALRRIQRAIALSPGDPHAFFFYMALTMPHNMLGHFADACIAGQLAIDMNPNFSSSYKGYLVALGLGGRRREAEPALRKLLELEPDFSVAQAIARSPLTRSDDLSAYAEGLRLAGLAEQVGATQLRLAIED